MKEINSNINIIGGGLIGAATALSLSSLGYKITVLEKGPAHKFNNSSKDKRTVAISEGTKLYLEKIGIWNEVNKFSEPIKKIKIIDRRPNNLIDFNNKRRNSNLGYIAKNKKILDVIYKHLNKNPNIQIFNETKIENIEYKNDTIITNGNFFKIKSNLNIAADGKNSSIRKLLKTTFFSKNYFKKALVLTFSHSLNHNNTAYEFFYKHGPLAILLMQKEKDKYLSSIVWTNESDYLESINNLDQKNLISILNKKTINSVGKINKIYSKQLFPISAHLNTRFYEKRTIYVGDSAHSVHPIAGQGWNLGMKDVEIVYKLLNKYNFLGIEPGTNSFCKEYHNDTFYRAYRLYQLTDKLDYIFQNENLLSYYARITGSGFIQRSKKLKNAISDFAMGFN